MKDEFPLEFKNSKFNQTSNFSTMNISRGISADTNKKINKGVAQISLSSLISQMNKNENSENPFIVKEKMHSLSPPKNNLPEYKSYII